MVIQTNILALNASRYMGLVTDKNRKSIEKLSSGYKINRSADDAAGLAISEKMRRQIRGLTQASANAQDGISLVQIADGALAEVDEMLHRGTELSVKAANGTLSDEDREYIQTEIEQLKAEIDGISERTTFNEIQVLKGKEVPATQTGTNVVVRGSLPAWATLGANGSLSQTYQTTENFTLTGATSATPVTINHAAATIDFSAFDGSAAMINDLIGSGFHSTCCTCSDYYSIEFTTDSGNSLVTSSNNYIYKIGLDGVTDTADLLNRIISGTNNGNPNSHYTMLNADTVTGILTIYDDRSMDANPYPSVNGTAQGTWDSSWTHHSFNVSPSGNRGTFGPGAAYALSDAIKLADSNPLILQVGSESGQELEIDLPAVSSSLLGIEYVDLSTQSGATSAIDSFKSALSYVSGERSRMGAYQNRLEHTIRNLDNVVENTTDAESQIRDTDMSTEMVSYSNSSILLQAAQAMLAQANQSSQGILTLLQG